MVVSKIDPYVFYPENKKLDPRDAKMESSLYEMHILGTDIIVAIGKSKEDLQEKDILYYPIYLVKSNNKVIQIGVFEIINSTLSDYLDANTNSINIEKMQEPRLYSFVTREMLLNKRRVPEARSEEERERKEGSTPKETQTHSTEIPDIRKDTFILTKGVPIPVMLREETKRQATDIMEKYKKEPSHTWLQEFMQNQNYEIIDNEGGGDCFFATIRDAFSSIAQQTSVQKIRKKLAEEANEETFLNYRELYDMYKNALIKETEDVKNLAKEYSKITTVFNQTLDRATKKQLIEVSKNVKQQHDNIVKGKRVTSEILNEFKFMKDVDTLEKFKKKITTCEFWAETWAISTLERALNIKFILFSHERYSAKDADNVLQCGQLNDSILQNKGEFTPEFYIIVEYTGQHYKLIGYKKKMIFTFNEIPYDIKKRIVDKCMEKNAGPFAIIPDFKRFKDALKGPQVAGMETQYEDLSDAKLRGIYDSDVVLQFYSKSMDKPLPGKGSGEKIEDGRLKEFSELAIIPQWRKKLSNFWVQPFMVDNHKWSSVENYYQASKFKKNNPEFYLSFSLDSGTELSKNPEMAKSAGGKSGKYKGELLRPKEVEIDPDFFGKRQKKEMYAAQYAKFNQNEDLKKLLLATQRSKLTHFIRGREPDIFEELMMVRNELGR
jgi:predicted NAD-dependent protein-ADP-ribosyltransferase YbiA (DUF1768 family)